MTQALGLQGRTEQPDKGPAPCCFHFRGKTVTKQGHQQESNLRPGLHRKCNSRVTETLRGVSMATEQQLDVS